MSTSLTAEVLPMPDVVWGRVQRYTAVEYDALLGQELGHPVCRICRG